MSADLLRRAAAVLREHAERAARGPWDVSDDGLVWPGRLGDPVSGSSDITDAEYIALMHPPVALALADWLDEAATHRRGFANTARAMAVARAILREEES